MSCPYFLEEKKKTQVDILLAPFLQLVISDKFKYQ